MRLPTTQNRSYRRPPEAPDRRRSEERRTPASRLSGPPTSARPRSDLLAPWMRCSSSASPRACPSSHARTISSCRSREHRRGEGNRRSSDASAGRGPMVRQIVIELEAPGDSRTMFRLRIDESLVADDLTAAQAHVLIGEIFERITFPKSSEGASPAMESDAAMKASSPLPSLGQSRLRAIVGTLLGRDDAAAS